MTTPMILLSLALAIGILIGRATKRTYVIRYDLTDYDDLGYYVALGASCEDEARIAVLRQRATVLAEECRTNSRESGGKAE